jgi:hypothetical protein
VSDLKKEALKLAETVVLDAAEWPGAYDTIIPAVAAALLRERAEEADIGAAMFPKDTDSRFLARAAELRAAADELEGK